MENLKKGFIKTSNGDIILPISRGELIFDAAGNIALHSPVFKAEAKSGVKYTQEEINAAREGDDAYGKSIKMYKTGTGKYGLMAPEDLLNLYEALARIDRIEQQAGIGGGGTGENLAQKLQDLINKVGYQKDEVIGKNDDGTDNIASSDSGIYSYINKKIIDHLAQYDALKYKGTLGVEGKVTELPTKDINNGDTYKVITSGTYAGKTAKLGDLFIALYTPSDGVNPAKYTWELVPSGNEQETFIKVQQVPGAESQDITLSGTVEFTGANGITVRYVKDTDSSTGKVVIAGTGSQTENDLVDLQGRVTDLETTVNGIDNTPGLIQNVGKLQEKINNSVTTLEEAVEKKVGEDGQPTEELENGDDLVKASALYDLAVQLSQYIANNYLQAETMDLNTSLTANQKAYLAGAIVN